MRTLFAKPLTFALTLAAVLPALPTLAHAAEGDVLLTTPLPPQRRDGAGKALDNPAGAGAPDVLSTANCKDNQSFDFHVVASGNMTNPAPVLQAWAGTADCTVLANREGPTAPCWPVSPVIAPPATAGGAFTANVRVQDVLSQLYTTPPKNPVYTPADGSVCARATQDTSVSVFILATEASVLRGSTAPYTFPVRVIGPSSPVLTSVRGADGALDLSFLPPGETISATDPDAGAPASQPNIVAYDVYCSPQPAEATTPATVESGADPALCAPNQAIFDRAPDGGAGTSTPDDAWLCKGHETIAAGASTQARLSGFKNGYAYNVAIAAIDIYGNKGQRSEVMCGVPRAATPTPRGDDAGGASCSVKGAGMPLGAGGMALFGVGAALVLVRRRRAARGSLTAPTGTGALGKYARAYSSRPA